MVPVALDHYSAFQTKEKDAKDKQDNNPSNDKGAHEYIIPHLVPVAPDRHISIKIPKARKRGEDSYLLIVTGEKKCYFNSEIHNLVRSVLHATNISGNFAGVDSGGIIYNIRYFSVSRRCKSKITNNFNHLNFI